MVGKNQFLSLSLAMLAWAATYASGASVFAAAGVVATGHALATEAAVQTARAGGNAIDAAVTAGLVLGVVDGFNSGIGGGCFLLIHLPGGEQVAIDGRERAPMLATRDMYLRDGKADPELSQTGPLAVAVPGALAAYAYAAENFGTVSMKEQLMRAAQLAEKGFKLDARYAARLRAEAEELKKFPAARAVFFRKDELLKTGDILKQADLGRTYRMVAEHGTGWFYGGPFSREVSRWMEANGGLIRREDFEKYEIRLREPVVSTYRGYTILGFPPPSSGGVHVAQILNILENFDLKAFGPGSADMIHVVTEAMKLAFADRAHWLGDPDFVPVPRGLVSKEYGKRLAGRVRMDRAVAVPQHSIPDGAGSDLFGKHTTHFSTADASGIWVACTATINTSFGSKVIVPGTGVVLNNEMDDFSAQPGVANYFGLIGAEANAIAPGKRPLSSMSPTIVLKDGAPIMSVGAAGGPTIISQTVLAIVNTIDFGMGIKEALASPRFHHQWRPDVLRIEGEISSDVIEELKKRGHSIEVTKRMGAAQAVAWEEESGRFVGAGDPRTGGVAGGW